MNYHLAMHNQLPFKNTPLFLDSVLRPVANDDLIRPKLENFISSTYKSIFNARLKTFLPDLVAATTANDEIRAAFGYCDATQDSLFLESYLDSPVETVLSQRVGYTVQRHHIVEVGNLSITKSVDSVKIMRDIAGYLQGLGYEWIVCTATRYLKLLFLKSGTKPISIAKAHISKVTNDGTDWGNYYVTAPEILVGNIDQSITLIEQKIASSWSLPNHNSRLISFKNRSR